LIDDAVEGRGRYDGSQNHSVAWALPRGKEERREKDEETGFSGVRQAILG